MITERSFAASFHDFWRELLPLLTPSCVHLLNSGHQEHLLDEDGGELGSVEPREETRDFAVVSEFAYYLAREAFGRSLGVRHAFADGDIRGLVQGLAVDVVNRYEGASVLPDPNLNASELEEGLELALRYESFARQLGRAERCAFQIPIQGAGFLPACNADLVLGDYLIEVKTVKRSLAGKDIRQLIVYLALGGAAHLPLWHHAGFFNPRRATYHKFETRELIELLSGGKTVVDVFAELMDFVCSSDVQLDSTF
ncbi:MAG: hypothetical protein KAX38_07180 [Candidatus Krumholzibacteria bacterium]|nr:hypothetical protein [Candidatus Krumholzibacteria bacterium]